ncbi:MAG: nicotinate-nucleotide--dimethylbenzimidazole phosphoribosyltransferase [Abditibacteriota bacterium]|nr:nicotinate-nucleotide--dimethylbenzimidazole phosphoribosyltransferase [Abditibacteriota bacterium]
MTLLEGYIQKAAPADRAGYEKAVKRWNTLAKPRGAMGLLEELTARLAAIKPDMDISRKCVLVFASDTGVCREGITESPAEVTAFLADLMIKGQTSAACMAKKAGAELLLYDVGMLSEVPGAINRKTRRGTESFRGGPAMTREDAERAVAAGIEAVRDHRDEYDIFCTGEIGIGNTSTSTAITSVLTGLPPGDIAGPGSGLGSGGLEHKIRVIEEGIRANRPDPEDPMDVLQKLGGFDIAAMCGAFIGGAVYRAPIVMDGLISSVSALLPVLLFPAAKDYLIPSPLSAEPAAAAVMDRLDLKPGLRLEMALGEGTGAIALLPLLEMGIAVYKGIPVFYAED